MLLRDNPGLDMDKQLEAGKLRDWFLRYNLPIDEDHTTTEVKNQLAKLILEYEK